MTYSECLEILKNHRDSYKAEGLVDTAEAFDIAIKSVEIAKRREDNKPPKKLPCVCGAKRLITWYNYKTGMMAYECPKCGKYSPYVKHKSQLNAAWNEMIESEKQ